MDCTSKWPLSHLILIAVVFTDGLSGIAQHFSSFVCQSTECRDICSNLADCYAYVHSHLMFPLSMRDCYTATLATWKDAFQEGFTSLFSQSSGRFLARWTCDWVVQINEVPRRIRNLFAATGNQSVEDTTMSIGASSTQLEALPSSSTPNATSEPVRNTAIKSLTLSSNEILSSTLIPHISPVSYFISETASQTGELSQEENLLSMMTVYSSPGHSPGHPVFSTSTSMSDHFSSEVLPSALIHSQSAHVSVADDSEISAQNILTNPTNIVSITIFPTPQTIVFPSVSERVNDAFSTSDQLLSDEIVLSTQIIVNQSYHSILPSSLISFSLDTTTDFSTMGATGVLSPDLTSAPYLSVSDISAISTQTITTNPTNTAPVTTISMQPTLRPGTSGNLCPCECPPNMTNMINNEPHDFTDLIIEPKNTSAYRRKKVSAQDPRPSSKSMGSLALAILSAVFLLVVLSDALTFWGRKKSSL